MPEWAQQFLTGGVGVAIVSGAFMLIQNRTARKAEEKAEKKTLAEQKSTNEFVKLVQAIVSLEKSNVLLVAANIASLNDRITYLVGVFIEKGYVTIAEHKNLLTIYEAYKNIGGNGSIPALMERFKELEIR